MKKLLCILLALVMVCGIFAGCAKTDANPSDSPAPSDSAAPSNDPAPSDNAPADGKAHEGKRVLGVMMSLSDPTWIFINEIFERRFTAAGFEYTAVSGENDPLVQIEAIENGVVQGYDEILVIPVTGEAIADACKKAMDEGVFIYNFINDSVNHHVYRTVDAAYSGEVAVDYAVEWAMEKWPNAEDGSINAVILGYDGDAHTKERYDAAVAKIATYPAINLVDARSIEVTSIAGQSATENILTMNPDKEINLWIVLDSAQATGVNAALMADNSGVQDYSNVCMVSNALNEEAAGLLRLSRTNESVYRVVAASGGDTEMNVQQIVDQSVAWFNGEEVAPFSPVNVDKVTPDNLSDFGF